MTLYSETFSHEKPYGILSYKRIYKCPVCILSISQCKCHKTGIYNHFFPSSEQCPMCFGSVLLHSGRCPLMNRCHFCGASNGIEHLDFCSTLANTHANLILFLGLAHQELALWQAQITKVHRKVSLLKIRLRNDILINVLAKFLIDDVNQTATKSNELDKLYKQLSESVKTENDIMLRVLVTTPSITCIVETTQKTNESHTLAVLKINRTLKDLVRYKRLIITKRLIEHLSEPTSPLLENRDLLFYQNQKHHEQQHEKQLHQQYELQKLSNQQKQKSKLHQKLSKQQYNLHQKLSKQQQKH